MRGLIACEKSRIIAKAFEDQGHDVTSCDILPAERRGKHYHGDVMDILYQDWDFVIACPPCTFIANSGVRWLDIVNGIPTNQERIQEMEAACKFFNLFLDHPCKLKCIENPTPHKHAVKLLKRNYDQAIQPHQFGHGELKRTCLWLTGFPELIPTRKVKGREQKVWMMPGCSTQQEKRSRFFKGIARAMAEQWT